MTTRKPLTLLLTFALLSLALAFSVMGAGEKMKKQVISSGAIDATSTSYKAKATLVQTGVGFVKSASYGTAQGFWGARSPNGCCGRFTGGFTGNTNCSVDGKRNLSDITTLIDHIYLTKPPLCCDGNGNVDGDPLEKHNLADLTRLIDNIYLNKVETEPCL